MQQIVLDVAADQVSSELIRHGVEAGAHVHATVELRDDLILPMVGIANASTALHWLADEPDLYFDADLLAAGC